MNCKKLLAAIVLTLILGLSGCAKQSDFKEEDMVMKEWECTDVYAPIYMVRLAAHVFLL